jgi:Cytochrome c7 and related cytochrome c
MPQVFHRSTNTISRFSIALIVIAVALFFFATEQLQRSPYTSWRGVARTQPVPFSHQHHVGGLGLDCRYCHTSVEVSSFAGIPPTKTCMNCHAQIWTNAEMLAPVRESFRSGKPLVWTRANELPDFVYFDHSIHIHKGVGCDSCHGPVDRMPLMYAANTLQMEWCLNCHRAPEKFLRPRAEVFNIRYEPPSAEKPLEMDGRKFTDQHSLGTYLLRKYKVRSVWDITSCNTCHR